MSPQLEDIKNKAVPVLKEAGVTRSSVFGSYTQNQQRQDSDIDILVEVPRGTGLFAFSNLQRNLESALGKKVDLVTFNSLHPRLKKTILNQQVPLL